MFLNNAKNLSRLANHKAIIKQKIASVKTEFEHLAEIRDRFQELIARIGDRYAKEIANNFKEYILGLDKTFEKDFPNSQANLEFFEFLNRDKREEFYKSFQRAFERYINDRLAIWESTAKDTLAAAFKELNEQTQEYKLAYEKVVDVINEKLLGYRFYAVGNEYQGEKFTPWADRVEEVFGGIPDTLNRSFSSLNGFVGSITVTVSAAIIFNFIGLLFTLNVLGAILATLSVGAMQAEYVRREFIGKTKKEFTKYLPTIAKEQSPAIDRAVRQCFKEYDRVIIDQLNLDISSRQTELQNLLQQKEKQER